MHTLPDYLQPVCNDLEHSETVCQMVHLAARDLNRERLEPLSYQDVLEQLVSLGFGELATSPFFIPTIEDALNGRR